MEKMAGHTKIYGGIMCHWQKLKKRYQKSGTRQSFKKQGVFAMSMCGGFMCWFALFFIDVTFLGIIGLLSVS